MGNKAKKSRDERCHQCDKTLPPIGDVLTEINGKQVLLCGSCWNRYAAKHMGSDFDTIELKPITLRDCEGKPHEFHFFTHLAPSGLAINAREMIGAGQAGYSFSVHGPHGCSQEEFV